MVGGGGGGGGGAFGNLAEEGGKGGSGGGAGGAGARTQTTISVTPGENISITVGNNGGGGLATNTGPTAYAGGAGGITLFGSTTAAGGSGGGAGVRGGSPNLSGTVGANGIAGPITGIASYAGASGQNAGCGTGGGGGSAAVGYGAGGGGGGGGAAYQCGNPWGTGQSAGGYGGAGANGYVSISYAIAGVCGTANNRRFLSTETSYSSYPQCSLGTSTLTTFPVGGTPASWYCANSGVNSPQCSATKNRKATITNGTLTYSVNTSANIAFAGFSAADADSDTLTYAWSCTNGGTFTSNAVANPTYVAPSTALTDTCTLLVSDTHEGTTSSTVTVTVNSIGVSCGSAGGLACNRTVDGLYNVDKFSGTGTMTWTVPAGVTSVTYLVVAGGGGGGTTSGAGYRGGGGGGGGFLTGTTSVTGSYTVTVGAGGAAGSNGGNSVFGTVTANGGGGGANDFNVGLAGGSGGGGGANPTSGYQSGGSGTSGQGNAGGTGGSDNQNFRVGGGGGGAGSVGYPAANNDTTSGNGGAGLASSITGASVYYAGGGGGGGVHKAGSSTSTVGGVGGGGSPIVYTSQPGTNGLGGGGSGSGNGGGGGLGGSGIVILRYLTPVGGVCGSSNGGIFSSTPSTNLCISGTASAVSGTGPWAWTCAGSGTANCSATKSGASSLNGWSYRVPIAINNTSGSALTNYQAKINTTLYNETGLIGSWHLDESSGTAAFDSSGNANNGVVTGTTLATGISGSGKSFNGTSDYIVVTDSPSLRISNYTAEVWIKPNGVPNETWKGIIGKPGRNFNIWLNNTGYIHHKFHSSISTNDGIDTPAGLIVWDSWNHIVITNDGTTAKTYINGIEAATGSSNGSQVIDNNALYIGRNLDGAASNYFNGVIDEPRIYNRALSAAEILSQYNAQKVKLDYSDIRFTGPDGSAQLSYWMEKDATFWVKVPSVPTGTSTIYMYYGNPTVVSTSSFTDAFSTGLQTWLKTDSVAGISNGGAVAALVDSSGNSNSATQATGTKQPAYTQNILNGKPVLRFVAANSQTMTVAANFPAPTTVIYVGKLNGGANGRMLTALNNNWLLGFWSGGKRQAYFMGWVSPSGTPAADTGSYIYSTTIGGTGINSTVYENGTNFVSNQSGITGPNGLSLSGANAATEFSNGDIAEVLVYNSTLADMARTGIERYLAGKYGITYSLYYIDPTSSFGTEEAFNYTPTISSLTSTPNPVNQGANITYNASWSDLNRGDVEKVHICKTNAISGQVCSGGTWCNSSGFLPTSPIACSYAAQSADIGTKNYYGFVCDDSDVCSVSTAGTFTVTANGTCGSSNNQNFASTPNINLCSVGTASSVSGAGPWTWTCTGSTGSPASCSAAYSLDCVSGGGLNCKQTIDGLYKVNTYTLSGAVSGNGTWTPPAGITQVEALVVAGGGGGGGDNGGGGGAGGLIYNPAFTVSAQGYSIAVGAGGSGSTVNADDGSSGQNSQFGALISVGGGRGASGNAGLSLALTGGSGGGGDGERPTSGTVGTAAQGNSGGNGLSGGGGGGGGAGAVGGNSTAANKPGNGGVGLAYSISGSPTWYAGGGGGGPENLAIPLMGYGGGSDGGGGAGGSGFGIAGSPNTGGGGGGSGWDLTTSTGGAGGSGIVIIRYFDRIDGFCGTANGQSYTSTATIDTSAKKCTAGTYSGSFTDNASTWTWTCNGTGTGAINGSCYANKSGITRINGKCGTANYSTVSSAPTQNLCIAGNQSAVTTNATTYTWICGGIGGGADDYGVANMAGQVTNGTCGSSNTKRFTSVPTVNLCTAGVPTAVFGNGPWTWACNGVGTGATNQDCSATKSLPLWQEAAPY
jgi:hypothetical protein